MIAKLRSSLSYANVMGTVAVFVALGGTSYAVATGSIDSREIKNNTVRSKDIRNNNVTTRDLRDNSVRGVDVRNDGLTGTDINESRLGNVPSATSANSAQTAQTAQSAVTAANAGSADIADDTLAVNGQSVNLFNMVVGDNQPEERFDFDGVVVNGDCLNGEPNLDVLNNTTGEIGVFSQGTHHPNGTTTDTTFLEQAYGLDPTSETGVHPSGTDRGAGTLTVTNLKGRVVTLVYSFNDQGPGGSSQCHYWGHAISG